MADPLDGGSEPLQVFHHARIASVDVMYLVDGRDTVGNEPCEYETRPRTNISGFHRCPAQSRLTSHERVVAFGLHVGAEPGQFVHEAKTSLEEVLRH